MKKLFRNTVAFLTLMLAFLPAESQIPDSITIEKIAVTARPSVDSITIRWAPLTFKVWQSGNVHGYKIERFAITRNGSIIHPEKAILHPSVKPLPHDQWEKLVHNKYAAIAAQALFGDRFEVDLRQSDIFTIVNKVRENEQRFAFALFSADMSPEVARASGLWFADKQVKKGEKYLYRVFVNSIDSLRGSIFIGPEDPYHLPQPKNLKADFKNQIVSLKWDKDLINYYTASIVERSDDGVHFTSISDSPLVTVSPTDTLDTRYEYALDSLKDLSKIYSYRVKGITAFGETGPPSDVVAGKATPSVDRVPYISGVENKENKILEIQWDFPHTNNLAIKGFNIERSSQPKGKISSITEKLLPPDTRVFEDQLPKQVNYYRVSAHGLDGEQYHSHVYFAQLVDSVAPTSPIGLEVIVNDSGSVSLFWKTNPELDIYGYRIYKAYHQSEELAQITSEPIRQSFYTDHVDLNTLNEVVYYSVMAVDVNQNHSSLSEILKVALPDKVKPLAPVFLPVENTYGGVSLRWPPGASEDIRQYAVYRKSPGQAVWKQVKIIDALSDTIYNYLDENSVPGDIHYYTVVSIDETGLESEPANPVIGIRIDHGLRPSIAWKKPFINREQNQITLTWNYTEPQIKNFKIFRSTDHKPPIVIRIVDGSKREFSDTIIPGQYYSYRIMAVFDDEHKSSMSNEILFRY
ncbi:MAG: hypothetical protein WD824_25215 [Cyclobacteriaceae bacterium]